MPKALTRSVTLSPPYGERHFSPSPITDPMQVDTAVPGPRRGHRGAVGLETLAR